jgi:hypothetical protein
MNYRMNITINYIHLQYLQLHSTATFLVRGGRKRVVVLVVVLVMLVVVMNVIIVCY